MEERRLRDLRSQCAGAGGDRGRRDGHRRDPGGRGRLRAGSRGAHGGRPQRAPVEHDFDPSRPPSGTGRAVTGDIRSEPTARSTRRTSRCASRRARSPPESSMRPSCSRRRWPDRGARRRAELDRRPLRERVGADAQRGARGAAARRARSRSRTCSRCPGARRATARVRNLTGVKAGESAVYRRLRDAGAVVVGVTNMHELGAGSTGHISAYGPVRQPVGPGALRRRVVGRLGPRPSARGWSPARSAPTAAARSATRPPTAASRA